MPWYGHVHAVPLPLPREFSLCLMARLCELVVKNEADVLTLIEQGGAVRKVASTNMNERSSRSHSCFTIKVIMLYYHGDT